MSLRSIQWTLGLSLVSIGIVSAACGTSTPAVADAGAKCGPGPYATIHATATSYTNNAPLEGVTLTLDPSPCPASTFTTDSTGTTTVELTTGVAVNPRIEKAGYLIERTGEQIYRGNFDASAPMFPTLTAGLLPHWSTTAPDLLVVLNGATPDAASCSTVAGATVSVVGHPEAVITYYQPGGDGGAPLVDTALTSTTDIGIAEVSGLKGGQTVQLELKSPTCPTASFVSYPHTGRYVLEDGVLTGALGLLVPEK